MKGATMNEDEFNREREQTMNDDELKREREREWNHEIFIEFLCGVGVLLACGAFTFLLVFIVSLITGESMCY